MCHKVTLFFSKMKAFAKKIITFALELAISKQ